MIFRLCSNPRKKEQQVTYHYSELGLNISILFGVAIYRLVVSYRLCPYKLAGIDVPKMWVEEFHKMIGLTCLTFNFPTAEDMSLNLINRRLIYWYTAYFPKPSHWTIGWPWPSLSPQEWLRRIRTSMCRLEQKGSAVPDQEMSLLEEKGGDPPN